MKRLSLLAALALSACERTPPAQRYGFIARLGNDTISLESVSRTGNQLTIDGVDRFPRVRQRHTEITLAPDGGIRRLTMDVTTPSEPEKERKRHIVANVTNDSVVMTKRDDSTNLRWAFATGGATMMAHVPQMYSLYDLYFQSAVGRMKKPDDTVHMRQFYIDREFDRFSLHNATVHRAADGKAEIWHDWLSGNGDATVDSFGRLQRYSGARTTYKVSVERLAGAPDIQPVATQFAAAEAKGGGAKSLSVRDTARATIGAASFSVDYGRPLARGRQLLGDVIPFGVVWRTGANAATQFTTSAPITLAGISVPAGAYTLWTLPRANGVELIVNRETGQWGTGYNPANDLARAPMQAQTVSPSVEEFTISIRPIDDRRGTLVMEWGPFRWSASVIVGQGAAKASAAARGR